MHLAYMRNWDDINYNAPRFARRLIEQLPAEAIYLVDEEFVLDFLRAGRKTIAFRALLEQALPESFPYDYRVASRSTDRYFADKVWDDELERVVGDPDERYGCYAKVYRRR